MTNTATTFSVDIARNLTGDMVTFSHTVRVAADTEADALTEAQQQAGTGYTAMWATVVQSIMTNNTYKGWTLADPSTNPGGFWFVLRPDGSKYGQTQTEAAARIMRRRAVERNT